MAYSALLVQEIKVRTAWRGSSKIVAHDLGLTQQYLLNLRSGAPVGRKAAARILAKVREDDLALADKIEDELLASWRDELRRLDQ